jgi:predicted neuraminidase
MSTAVALALLLLAPQSVSRSDQRSHAERTWQGIPGLERTPHGRLFVSWFSGGSQEPAPENTVYLCYSDNQAQTFTEPVPMAGPIGTSRTFDPTLWRDPTGKIWYIFNRGDRETAQHGVYARTCAEPDAKPPVWSDEFRVGYDEVPLSFRVNKPTVLSTGQWLMPVTHAAEPIHDWFAGPQQLQGVGISTDRGRSWTLRGALTAPPWALENMLVELRDGRLWMLIRTGSGFLWQSHSADGGNTWTVATASAIANPGSRFFIRRLASGRLLLVNHYKFTGRSHLTAQLSTDDGNTWNEGLLLDERSGISYPDGVQAEDDLIWIVYDRDRQEAGEILLATFREEDVAAGRNVSGHVRLRQVINKLK